MTVLKRRTRMVNFRLSEEEYKDLKNICVANGARSVSDFARAAVCQMVGNTNGNGAGRFESTVRELSGRFEELKGEVKRLAQFVEEVRRGAPGLAQPAAGARKGLSREKLCGISS